MPNFSKLYDERIKSWNYLLEVTIQEYLALAKLIIDKNEFQRGRVKASHSVYSLLKEDILKGCIIPPIVLAHTGSHEIQEGDIQTHLKDHKDDLVILDGLQRTNTIIDLERDLLSRNDESALAKLRNQKIRIELYTGINRLGVLYRMLTLNTGQTPMTLRQQVEMLYTDYLRTDVDNIRLIREVDDKRPAKLGEYSFKDIVEGFNSYLERNELPIDRFDLLESISSLEKLAKENQENDLFAEQLKTYHSFVKQVVTSTETLTFTAENLTLPGKPFSGQPFGKDALSIFTKAQAISGFGAGMGRLKDFNLINGFADVLKVIPTIDMGPEPRVALEQLLRALEEIRLKSKKIGNAQRMFFQYFFRELFNGQGDSYLKFQAATTNGYQKYLSQT